MQIVSGYATNSDERRVPAHALTDWATAVFERCGMDNDGAWLVADTLTFADLRGCHSHGVIRIPEYVRKLTVGGVNPRGRPQLVSDRTSALVVDGGNSMGQVASVFAMRAAINRARDTGVAMAAVRGSNHNGALSYYAMMGLPETMIGLASTNALPTMAPWGGIDKILGINPLAVAIPAAAEQPIVFDAAFSASSHGRIRVFAQKGLPLPEGWAFDKDGNPTTDIEAALQGLLQPIGGYKGTGLAMIFGLLSTMLSGAAYGTELGNMVDGPTPGADGHVFVAINVDAFEDPSVFRGRIDRVVHQIRKSRPAPANETVLPPGHLETMTAAKYLEEGIPLNAETLRGLDEVAATVGSAPLER